MTELTKLNGYFKNEEVEQKFFAELIQKIQEEVDWYYKVTPPTDSFSKSLDFSKIDFSKIVYDKNLHCIDLKEAYKEATKEPFSYACLYFDSPYEIHFNIAEGLFLDFGFRQNLNDIYTDLMAYYFGLPYQRDYYYNRLEELGIWPKNIRIDIEM